ncbi:hypothetical protein [uncultured Tenacibaculum sp.]|uniref:hypothetical protein n=1 Tax=uncultured Tenacibaculum sp. TaxID=174713 RepID=UPI00260AF4ED|nr:hypothetical protein [uncultured Tenacibaculum sp.]
MKKSILNIGKVLAKTEQKSINGGISQCDAYNHCSGSDFCCSGGGCKRIGASGVICDAEIPKPDDEFYH